MRRPRLVVLVAALGVTACVGVSDGGYQAPYGAFSGSSNFVTPYTYRRGPDAYLYDQSQRSWRPNAYRQGRYYDPPNRYDRHTRYDGPRHRDDPRGTRWPGHDNRRDRD